MKYQLGKDIQGILSRLDNIEATLRFKDANHSLVDHLSQATVSSNMEEEEAMDPSENSGLDGPEFISLEGRFVTVPHPSGHTLFSFLVNKHNTLDTRSQFQQLIIAKGQELRSAGLTQNFANDPTFLSRNVRIGEDRVLCICSYRPPNLVTFITVSWFPNTGTGGPGASYMRRSDGSSTTFPGNWVVVPFTSVGTTYAKAAFADTGHEPSYSIRQNWDRP